MYNSLITPAYEKFLENPRGTGVAVTIEYEEYGEASKLAIKCVGAELEEVLMEQIPYILGKNIEIDPELESEIRVFAQEIKSAIRDGENFSDTFDKCAISAEELEHPLLSAKPMRGSDGRLYLMSKAYRDREDGEYVKMSLEIPDGRRTAFACELMEANVFLARAIHEVEKMLGKPMEKEIREALRSAKTPDFTVQAGPVTMKVENTYIDTSPLITRSFDEEDWLTGHDDDDLKLLDDDDVKMLKSSRTKQDRMDEHEEDEPEQKDDEYEDSSMRM